MIVVGVDPGFKTGIAVVDTAGPRLDYQHTLTAWDDIADTLHSLDARYFPSGPQWVVIQTPIFEGKTPRWNKSPISLVKNGFLAGRIAGYCQGLGWKIMLMPPKRKSGMKMSAELFKEVFQYGDRTSQHVRDAANLALQADNWREDM